MPELWIFLGRSIISLMKKKLLVLVGVVILVLASFYLYFRTIPQYSLYQLRQAYKTRDLALAKQYVDIDSLSDQLGEETAKIVRDEINKPSTAQNEWEKLGEELGKSLVESYMPALQQQAKDQFKKSFTEAVEGKSEPNKNFPEFKPLGWRDLLPGGRIKIQKAGAIRLVTLPNQEGDLLTFRMRHEEGKWKIVAWENFGDIAKELAKEDSSKNGASTKNAKFGDKVDINQGWFLTVSIPEQYAPQSQFDRAEQGKKFITVEVIYENTGGIESTYDASNFELKDSNDHRYKREYSGREPILDSGVLPSGQKAKGYITYEIPDNEDATEVIYSSVAGGIVIFSNE